MIKTTRQLVEHGFYSRIAKYRTKISARFHGIFGIFLQYYEIYICLKHYFWRKPSVMVCGNTELRRTAVGKASTQPSLA
jgi:hypothetical protein